MARVAWSPSSLRDLEAIAEFIARDSPQYAALFVQRVMALVEKMSDTPLAGRVVPEYGREDIREFIAGDYRIVYRIAGEALQVAAVTHGSRRLPDAPPQGAPTA